MGDKRVGKRELIFFILMEVGWEGTQTIVYYANIECMYIVC